MIQSIHTLVNYCENQGEFILACELPTTSEAVRIDQLMWIVNPLSEELCDILNEPQLR